MTPQSARDALRALAASRARRSAAAGRERHRYRGEGRRRAAGRAGLPRLGPDNRRPWCSSTAAAGSPAISIPTTGRRAACDRDRRGGGLRRLPPPAGNALSRRVRGRFCRRARRDRAHRRIRRRQHAPRRRRRQRGRQSRRNDRDRLPRRRVRARRAAAGLSGDRCRSGIMPTRARTRAFPPARKMPTAIFCHAR